MKHLLLLLLSGISIFIPSKIYAQKDAIQLQVDSLSMVPEMPYICPDFVQKDLTTGCGDDIFWRVVQLKEKAIPYLIAKLSDSTTTTSFVPMFGGYYTVADIAYSALEEIVHGIPTFKLLGVKFDKKGCGYCSYWQHLNSKYSNRLKFQKAVQQWYSKNQSKLVWVASDQVAICDCSAPHPNKGHYELANQLM